MKKRILCLLMAAALLLGVLAGCGGGAASSDAVTATPQPQPTTGPEDEPANTDGEAEPSDAQQESDVDTPPVEEPDDGLGEGVYVVTRNDLEKIAADFVGYACECAATGKPYKDIDDLLSNGQRMPISGDMSLVKADSRMRLESNYENNHFDSFLWRMKEVTPRENFAITWYSVQANTEVANFHDFHYYENTQAELVSLMDITINYRDRNNNYGSIEFEEVFRFLNETDNPEQWLILARSGKGDLSDIQVNEDGASNNLSWSEVYRTFLCPSEDLDNPIFTFLDADSDGVPEALYREVYGRQMFRINQNNVPEACDIEAGRIYKELEPHCFDEAVRQYELYTEGMNNNATVEILRAYQEILPEDFDWPVDENGEEYVPDDYKYHSTDLFIDDFGSGQIMMLFGDTLYQYKDGKAVKVRVLSEFEELSGDNFIFLGVNNERTMLYASNYRYNADTDIITKTWAAIDSKNFNIIKTLTVNAADSVWRDRVGYLMYSPPEDAFISAFEVSASGTEEIKDYYDFYDREIGYNGRLYYSTLNTTEAYLEYITRCVELNAPAC